MRLMADFAAPQVLYDYSVDPRHCDVIEWATHDVVNERTVVDFELPEPPSFNILNCTSRSEQDRATVLAPLRLANHASHVGPTRRPSSRSPSLITRGTSLPPRCGLTNFYSRQHRGRHSSRRVNVLQCH